MGTQGKTCDPPGAPPTYCPGEPITREAMAAFVHRGFGRIAGQPYGADLALAQGSEVDLVVLTLDAGGVPGSIQFVKLDGFATTYIENATGCPCFTRLRIVSDGLIGALSNFSFTANTAPGSAGIDWQSAPVAATLSVPGGTTQTFRLKAVQLTAGTVAQGPEPSTAITAPFGSTGTNTP